MIGNWNVFISRAQREKECLHNEREEVACAKKKKCVNVFYKGKKKEQKYMERKRMVTCNNGIWREKKKCLVIHRKE